MKCQTARLVEVCEADFNEKVLEAKDALLVVFLAHWSQPCRVLLSTLKGIVSRSGGKIRVAVVNADNSLLLSVSYEIQSIPTLICFSGGIERGRIIGTASEEAILSGFKPFLNPEQAPPSTQ
jgi:thioredoxin 1